GRQARQRPGASAGLHGVSGARGAQAERRTRRTSRGERDRALGSSGAAAGIHRRQGLLREALLQASVMTSPQPLQQGRTLAELEQLLRSAGARLLGAAETRALRVTDVVQDSRRVTPGALFVARAGTATTGARYVEEARSRGAVAVLSEPGSVASEPRLEVDDLALGWALAAHEVFGRPSEVLPVVGVTGTNGKTTVACLLEHALAELGGRP